MSSCAYWFVYYLFESFLDIHSSSLSILRFKQASSSLWIGTAYIKRRNQELGTMASVELPKKYKAAVYDKPGSISTKVEELDMPEPGAGEVLINL
jgi:hypothetical protein